MRNASRREALALLELQVAWGADECIEDAVSRTRTAWPALTERSVAPPAVLVAPTPPDSADAIYARYTTPPGSDLWRTATNMVRIEGHTVAGLLLLADTPSPEDDLAGHPFAGEDGVWLDQMLASIDLARADLLAGPLVPWRPPGDRMPSATDMVLVNALLDELLVLWRPAICVALGPLAARTLLGAAPRREKAPQWHATNRAGIPLRCLALPALSAIQTQAASRRTAWAGWRLLKATALSVNRQRGHMA